MDRETYEIEAKVEQSHWWFRVRRKLLGRLVSALAPALPERATILDVGCGTGANMDVLSAPGRVIVGVDRSPVPLQLQHESGASERTLTQADALALPFADRSFDLVLALDMLEHLEQDLLGAAELFRVCRPRGAAVIFVPALEALWGIQDDVSHHFRRYTPSELRGVLGGAGFEIERLTFFNTILFPAIFAARLGLKVYRPKTIANENQIGGPLANAIMERIFGLEPRIIENRDLPFGVSLACVVRRP